MAWDQGGIQNNAPWATLSTKLKNMMGATGVGNWSFVENVPAGAGAGQSGSASYSLDVFKCAGTGTDANDSGTDWYFIIEIPASDGAVTSSFNVMEDFDPTGGQKTFRRPAALTALNQPVGTGYWRIDTLAAYASVTGNNRANTVGGILNTTGFQYWIKLTRNSVTVSYRVAAAETTAHAGLLDSFVTNVVDGCPLVLFVADTTAETASSSFTRLPGVTAMSGGTASRGWQASFIPWTVNVATGTAQGATLFNNAVSTNGDLWQGGKIYTARIVCFHAYGLTSGTVANTSGYFRGLVKSDYLAIATGGTIQLGDTMVIGGLVYTVIKLLGSVGTSGDSHAWVTRPI